MNAPNTLEQGFKGDIGRAGRRAERVTLALERKAAFMKANVLPFVAETRGKLCTLIAQARTA